MLALVLPGGLRCSQAHQLLRGFWVNYGGVAALQVFCDGSRVTVVVMVTLQKEVIELGDVQTLCCTVSLHSLTLSPVPWNTYSNVYNKTCAIKEQFYENFSKLNHCVQIFS